MSVIVSGIRIPISEDVNSAAEITLKKYKLAAAETKASIYKVSIDARHGQIYRIVSVEIELGNENAECALAEKIGQTARIKARPTELCVTGKKKLEHPPVVIGFGPCGMFCALTLAKFGYRPIVLERGQCIDDRDRTVDMFQNGGALNMQSNIQFGEGGAGAYSDGKLTTRINDPLCEYVLNELTLFGAPEQIKRSAKPHIGTDVLKNIVRSIRNQINALGGSVNFNVQVKDIKTENGRICAVGTDGADIECEIAALCVGHSARDTFSMLKERGTDMSSKAFSIGVRIEHLQENINRALYGEAAGKYGLGAAEYSLSCRTGGRGCYSFCMCPGGFVVAAASEQGGVVTNGMSRHARDGRNANSAIAVSVLPADFENPGDPLSGIEFQRRYERAAFAAAGAYKAPVQLAEDFIRGRTSKKFTEVEPTYPIGTEFCDLNKILPEFVCGGLKTGLTQFGKKIKGFDCGGAVLTAPETRTSSPLRINRRDNMMSINTDGLIPCGEGAGYAGGIMSAAVDGIRAAMAVLAEYEPY